MIFSCFPPQEKCEWFHLREFVDRYDTSREKAYTLTACLDVEGRSDKEPELLLNAPEETPIVIERKSVVWPREEYFSDHRNEHDLHDLFLVLQPQIEGEAAFVMAETGSGLMAPPPSGPLQYRFRLGSGLPDQAVQQPAHLGNRQRYQGFIPL